MMAFGNMGDNSGTGVAFTRNPATGEKKLFGEFLMNAQGEDVVAGVRTPNPIAQLAEDVMPEVYEQFVGICNTLENHYRDMQDMEFTIEDGKLYMLQTRNGKRTAAAALKIACDLVDEGMIDEQEGRLLMIEPTHAGHPAAPAVRRRGAQGGHVLWPRRWPLLPELPAAASSSPPRTPRNGLQRARRSFWFAWRPLPRTSRA